MTTYFLLAGIVLFGGTFIMWLGAFILGRGLNTDLENAREGRRRLFGQLGYGIVLFAVTGVLAVLFFRIDRVPIIPPMPDNPEVEIVGDGGMGVTLVFSGIAVFGLAFLLWLIVFLINRSTNTALQTPAEFRRTDTSQLGLGALLLGITLVLGVMLSQMDRTSLVPDVSLEPSEKSIVQQAQPKATPTPSPSVESTETSTPDATTEPTPPAPAVATPPEENSETAQPLAV